MAQLSRPGVFRSTIAFLAAALVFPTAGPVAAATAVVGPPIGGCAPQVQGAVELLPDPRIAPLYGLTIRTTSAGRKHLRFGTKSWNTGDGPIEVRGENRVSNEMTLIAQRVFDDHGGCRDIIQPLAEMWYAGDGHNHWHLSKYMVTQLYKKTSSTVLRIRKTGFCLIDLHHMAYPPPNSPAERVYWNGACGNSDSTAIRMGVSVGYADDYPPLIALQWIDITGLPKDVYRLCTGVNPYGWWLERDGVGTNNYYWVDLSLNAAKSTFTVLARGRSACLK